MANDAPQTTPPAPTPEIELLREAYDFLKFQQMMVGPLKFATEWLPKVHTVLRPYYAHESEGEVDGE